VRPGSRHEEAVPAERAARFVGPLGASEVCGLDHGALWATDASSEVWGSGDHDRVHRPVAMGRVLDDRSAGAVSIGSFLQRETRRLQQFARGLWQVGRQEADRVHNFVVASDRCAQLAERDLGTKRLCLALQSGEIEQDRDATRGWRLGRGSCGFEVRVRATGLARSAVLVAVEGIVAMAIVAAPVVAFAPRTVLAPRWLLRRRGILRERPALLLMPHFVALSPREWCRLVGVACVRSVVLATAATAAAATTATPVAK
jgi:hypothetical protein